MNIFLFEDYKKYFVARIRDMPGRGKGQRKKIAQHLQIHSSFLTQIFRGSAHLSAEQAHSLGTYLGLSDIELRYFICLVQFNRASRPEFKKFLAKELDGIRKKSAEYSGATHTQAELTERDLSIFFSEWEFSAVYAALGIESCRTIDGASAYLNISQQQIRRIFEFLLSTGLAERDGEQVRMGKRRLHIPPGSPLVTRHHTNWRLQAIENAALTHRRSDFQFTFPLAIGDSDERGFREQLAKMIHQLEETLKETRPTRVVCFNIDWFDVKRPR